MVRPIHPVGDHIVELSIKIRGESYDETLRDPSSYYYQHLSELFIDKVSSIIYTSMYLVTSEKGCVCVCVCVCVGVYIYIYIILHLYNLLPFLLFF